MLMVLLVHSLREKGKGPYYGGELVDQAVTSVFAALIWHCQDLREELAPQVALSTSLHPSQLLQDAFSTAEALRRDLVESRQKLVEAKEKEEDEEKRSKVNEDAPRESTSFPQPILPLQCVECALHPLVLRLHCSCGLSREGSVPAQVCWALSRVAGWGRGGARRYRRKPRRPPWLAAALLSELAEGVQRHQHSGQAQAAGTATLERLLSAT